MNGKGVLGPQSIIVLFFILVVMIAFGIVIGIAIFFSSGYDYRETDALILNQKISNCLSDNPGLISSLEFERDFFSSCRLNLETIKSDYFILLELDNKEFYKLGSGDKTSCSIGEKNENYIKCVPNEIKLEDKLIHVTTGAQRLQRKVQT